jgi:Mn2+/Fe2+ NRAMP family transporter
VGGTVGGYISFAGGHRLLEAGVKGKEGLPEARRSAVIGILVASMMRVLLFLAALGVVSKGLELQQNNPAASIFKLSAGIWGFKLFGVVMWCAAITSVIGSAYTSFSFVNGFHPRINRMRIPLITIFILASAAIFMAIGQPVKILVYVGMLNGFILPLALGIMLVAAYQMKKINYRHPLWLYIFGVVVIIATAWMSMKAMLD